MTANTLFATELRQLLAEVSDHGKQHLIKVEADLMQTTLLLSEAIEQLGESFNAIHEAVTEQQKELARLLSTTHLGASDAKSMQVFKQKIEEEVNAVVTGLQFHDLTTQLIDRTVKRVTGFRELLDELASHGDLMESTSEQGEMRRLLEAINQSFMSRSTALDDGLRRAVKQKDMSSGDIDLF